jgi:hypothetical protein
MFIVVWKEQRGFSVGVKHVMSDIQVLSIFMTGTLYIHDTVSQALDCFNSHDATPPGCRALLHIKSYHIRMMLPCFAQNH